MPLRLLQLSDIHFGAENPAALKAATDFARVNPPDLLVLCGDITQVGQAGQFGAASAWLSGLPRPWLSTPGNHDTPWLGLWDRVTRPFDGYAQAVGPTETGFAAPGLAVAAINSARGWQIRLNWSKGALSHHQARAAARTLGEAPADAVRILVCHHPLVEPRDEPITARVRGGEAAARRLAGAEVDLILTGHLHVPFVEPLPFADQLTYAVGAGTLSLRERGAPPGFNTIEIDKEALLVTAMAWRGDRLEIYRQWRQPLRPRRSHAPANPAFEQVSEHGPLA